MEEESQARGSCRSITTSLASQQALQQVSVVRRLPQEKEA